MPTYQMAAPFTLAEVGSTACSLLSLPVPGDVAGSTDPNITLLRTVINMASNELLSAYEWAELTKVAEIQVLTMAPPSAEAVQKAYPLPGDFHRFIDQTQWNGSMMFPAAGPVSPQGWMTYMVFPITSNFTLTWQVREGQIWFLNPPADPGQTFRFMYLSKALVQDADDPDLFKDLATKNGDKFMLDGLLLTLLARVKWLEAKGFDSSTAARDFLLSFDARAGANKGANILSMAGGPTNYPLIGIGNVPGMSLYGMRSAGP